MKGGEDGIFRGVFVGSGGRRGGRWGREEVQKVGGLLGRDESGHGGVVSSSIDFLPILVDRSTSILDRFRKLLASLALSKFLVDQIWKRSVVWNTENLIVSYSNSLCLL